VSDLDVTDLEVTKTHGAITTHLTSDKSALSSKTRNIWSRGRGPRPLCEVPGSGGIPRQQRIKEGLDHGKRRIEFERRQPMARRASAR
jgi:hypothetical protein